jgi:hypothetical protein
MKQKLKKIPEQKMKYTIHCLALMIFFLFVNCNDNGPTNPSGNSYLGNWKLVKATCTLEGQDSCHVGLQLCPSFYSFSTNAIKKYETSYGVTCTQTGCDTTIYCYDSLFYNYSKINDTIIKAWGDSIILKVINDTLSFKRIMTNSYPKGTITFYFIKENQPIPYCSNQCSKNPF